MKHQNEKTHKQEGNKVLYWNGSKWLVRETFKNSKDAKDLLTEIKAWQKLS